MSKRVARLVIVGGVVVALAIVSVQLDSQHVIAVSGVEVFAGHSTSYPGMSYSACRPEMAMTPPPWPSTNDKSREAILAGLWAAVYNDEHPARVRICEEWQDSALHWALVILLVGLGALFVNERRR